MTYGVYLKNHTHYKRSSIFQIRLSERYVFIYKRDGGEGGVDVGGGAYNYGKVTDRSYQKAAPVLYNAVPVTMKTTTSLSVFKKRLKKYLFTKVYMV